MQIEKVRERAHDIIQRTKNSLNQDPVIIEAIRQELADLTRHAGDWADDRLSEAKREGRDTLHADDARKGKELRAVLGDAQMAVAEMLISRSDQERNRRQRFGADDVTRGNGEPSREWKSIVPSMSEYKMQSIGIDPAGGYLVEATVGPFFDRLRDDAVVLAAGPRFEACETDALEMPRLTGSTTATRLGEGADIPESEIALGKIRIPMQKYAGFTIGSSEWFADASHGPRQLVEMDQRKQIGTKIDADMLAANGTGIVGLRYQGTATSLAAAGATPTFDAVLNALYRMSANNAKPSAIFMNPRTWNSLRKVTDLQERYQLQPDPSKNADLRLFNVPVFLSNQISITEASDNAANSDCSSIVVVDMRFVVVGRRSSVTVLFDPYSYSKSDKIAVRSIARLGMGVIHNAAVEVLTGVRP